MSHTFASRPASDGDYFFNSNRQPVDEGVLIHLNEDENDDIDNGIELANEAFMNARSRTKNPPVDHTVEYSQQPNTEKWISKRYFRNMNV